MIELTDAQYNYYVENSDEYYLLKGSLIINDSCKIISFTGKIINKETLSENNFQYNEDKGIIGDNKLISLTIKKIKTRLMNYDNK